MSPSKCALALLVLLVLLGGCFSSTVHPTPLPPAVRDIPVPSNSAERLARAVVRHGLGCARFTVGMGFDPAERTVSCAVENPSLDYVNWDCRDVPAGRRIPVEVTIEAHPNADGSGSTVRVTTNPRGLDCVSRGRWELEILEAVLRQRDRVRDIPVPADSVTPQVASVLVQSLGCERYRIESRRDVRTLSCTVPTPRLEYVNWDCRDAPAGVGTSTEVTIEVHPNAVSSGSTVWVTTNPGGLSCLSRGRWEREILEAIVQRLQGGRP